MNCRRGLVAISKSWEPGLLGGMLILWGAVATMTSGDHLLERFAPLVLLGAPILAVRLRWWPWLVPPAADLFREAREAWVFEQIGRGLEEGLPIWVCLLKAHADFDDWCRRHRFPLPSRHLGPCLLELLLLQGGPGAAPALNDLAETLDSAIEHRVADLRLRLRISIVALLLLGAWTAPWLIQPHYYCHVG